MLQRCCEFPDLPLFVQFPDRFLQILLFLFWQNICELIAGFEKSIENSLIQLTEELLHETQQQT